MRNFFLGLTIVGFAINCESNTAHAQQRRPVTIYFRTASVTKTQWSPQGTASDAPAAGDSSTVGSQPSTLAPPSASSPIQNSSASNPALSNSSPAESGDNPSNQFGNRPTLQQLQNPSGMFQMTHSNFMQNHYTTPNNYVGSQYNYWNNLQPQSSSLDSFQSFNRTQPPLYSGAYISPNTYVGTNFNSWNNLSSGYAMPNYLGSYIYSSSQP